MKMSEIDSNGRSTLLFLFDAQGERKCGDSEGACDSKPQKSHTNKDACSLTRRCCKWCLLCVSVCILLVLIAFATAAVLVTSGFSNGGENLTFEETDQFYESWEAPSEIKEKAPTYIRMDKNNVTVWFVSFGSWSMDSLLSNNKSMNDLNTYIEQNFYRIRKSMSHTMSKADSRENATASWGLVVNMDGYGFGRAFDFTEAAYLKDMVVHYLGMLQTLEYAVVVNMPYLAKYIMALIKPIMGETLDKFELYGESEWLPVLLDRFSLEQLPPGYSSYVKEDANDDDSFW